MKKKNFLSIAASAMAAIALLASCSGDDMVQQPDNTKQNTTESGICVNGTDFVAADGFAANGSTRTALKPTDKGITFAWSEGDIVGVFSKTAKQQVPMYMVSGANTQDAQFESKGFQLMPGEQYVAYFPIVDKVTASPVVPVSYLGQTQDGNNSYANISKYDYMVSDQVTPESLNQAAFKLHHMGSILRLRITMPTADTYKSVTLSTGSSTEHKFNTEVNLDLFGSSVIVPTAQSNDMTVTLNNVSTTESDKTLTVWMMLSPTDLTGQPVSVTIASATEGVDDITCSYTPSKAYESGKAYSVSIDATTPEYVDLGLPSGNLWATCNIGASKPEESGTSLAWGADKFISSTSYGDYPCYLIVSSLNRWVSYKGSSSYDSARLVLGSHWATPSEDDWIDLLDNSNYKWTTLNGVNGLLVTGPNQKTIFLPASGYYSPAAGEYKKQGEYGRYWTSMFNAQYSGSQSKGGDLEFDSSTNSETKAADINPQYFYFGCSVRAIYVP